MKRYYVCEDNGVLYKVENNSVTVFTLLGEWVPSAHSVADVEEIHPYCQAFIRISHQKATAIRKAKLAAGQETSHEALLRE